MEAPHTLDSWNQVFGDNQDNQNNQDLHDFTLWNLDYIESPSQPQTFPSDTDPYWDHDTNDLLLDFSDQDHLNDASGISALDNTPSSSAHQTTSPTGSSIPPWSPWSESWTALENTPITSESCCVSSSFLIPDSPQDSSSYFSPPNVSNGASRDWQDDLPSAPFSGTITVSTPVQEQEAHNEASTTGLTMQDEFPGVSTRLRRYIIKPEKCPAEGCNKRFPFNSDVERHIKAVHSVTKVRFICSKCTKRSYARYDGLLRHESDKHGRRKRPKNAKRGRRKNTEIAESVDLGWAGTPEGSQEQYWGWEQQQNSVRY